MLNWFLVTVSLAYVACQTGQPLTTEKCPVHEVYSQCAPLCPEYCDGSQFRCSGCAPGCRCRFGFVRDRQTGQCVHRNKCHPNPCDVANCAKCESCMVDSKQQAHCIPDACCQPPLTFVYCFVNPCQVAKCSHPGAICIPNYCGGCGIRFYDANFRPLTEKQCSQKPN